MLPKFIKNWLMYGRNAGNRSQCKSILLIASNDAEPETGVEGPTEPDVLDHHASVQTD